MQWKHITAVASSEGANATSKFMANFRLKVAARLEGNKPESDSCDKQKNCLKPKDKLSTE